MSRKYRVTRYGAVVEIPYDPYQQDDFAASGGGKTGMEAAWEKALLSIQEQATAYNE